MKMKKMAVGIVGGAVVLVAGVGAVAVARIDAIARAAIERGATGALGVPTSLESADVGLLSGTFALRGLRIANPEAFADTGEDFLRLGEGGVAVSLGTLRGDVIELPHLRLADLAIDLQRRRGASNYGVILDHLNGADGTEAGEPADEGPGLIVREVTIRDVRVRVSAAPIGGEPTVVTIPIQEITLTDVGSEEPLPVGALAGVIVRAVLSTAVEQGGALLPADLASDLKGSLASLGPLSDLGVSVSADLGAEAERLLESAGAAADRAVDEVTDKAKDAKKTLEDLGKGLLPGSKKKPTGGGN